MTLEDKLFEDIRAGRQVDIERALLIASGCGTEERISEYKAKLDELEKDFDSYASMKNIQGEEETAKALHEFLWMKKPRTLFNKVLYRIGIGSRYMPAQGLLTEAIDRQMSPKERRVGNCFGLTGIYTVMGARKGLNMSVLYNDEHILSRVRTKEGEVIDIENTSKKGFGSDTQTDCSDAYFRLEEYGLAKLVGLEFNHKGKRAVRAGKREEAVSCFEKAAALLPEDPCACNNYGAALLSGGKAPEAAFYFTKALEKSPGDAKIYLGRSRARKAMRDTVGAELDWNMYRKLEGESR